MINSETPYKLAEIIRDTWPGLYGQMKECYDIKMTTFENESDRKTNTSQSS